MTTPTTTSSVEALPSPATQTLLSLVFVVFVVGWAFVGVRGLVRDDSRWAWGMFPYTLEVEVESVRFVDARGKTHAWKSPDGKKGGKPRIPKALRPGVHENYGYGEGAYDDLVNRVLALAAKDAGKRDVAVEAVVVTRRSERPERKRVVRRELQ